MKSLSSFPSLASCARLWALLAVLISAYVPQAMAADWVLDESKYTAYTSGDHLCLEVFLADLDRKNTYSKGGKVYATNGSKTIELMYLKYVNQGDDESQTAEVKAYLCEPNAKAWFTNSQSGDQQIGTSESSFWLTKWGSDHHYMTAKIDFYFPAELAGETWKIYYNFQHNNGDWYTKTLKYTIPIGSNLGMNPIDASKFSCERTGTDNIRFTVPKLPDDVPSKVNDVRTRYCYYDVSYVFHKQDGSKETLRNTYECDKYQAKSYDAAIPESVGNPKRIDVNVTARQGVKDPKADFWSVTATYNKNSFFKVIPLPGSIVTEFRQFDKVAALSWTQPAEGNFMTCTSYIYRVETDASGNVQSGKSWSRRGTVDNGDTNQSYTDEGLQMGTYYKYMVLNVPKDWIGKSINSGTLNNPDDALLSRLGYATTAAMSTAPRMSIFALQQDTALTDAVRLTWKYSRVPTDAATVKFQVLRKTHEGSDWAEYDNVTGDSQPSADTELSYTDPVPANVSTRYQYKVRLSLVDDKYRFESDAIYAGLLEGSKVKSFEATKGTHDATVRLSWQAKQVGSDNSTYVISRRYVNSNDDFMRIYTANGKSELYTYEDNTVKPGYYYEYKVEVYSGNVLQNTLYDVGFCQARGVISGRVTFGTGTAVEDVRLSLRPSDTGDDNTVKGFSQYVSGASTGITWQADSTELAKVFGEHKDFTVQMFVRPDQGLADGAVVGDIPGLGRILLGSQTDNAYELAFIKMAPRPAVDLSTLTGDYVAQAGDVLTGTLSRYVKVSIADGATVMLRDVTINRPKNFYDYEYQWAGISCEGDATILLSGTNHVKGFSSKYPGIRVLSGKTVTIKGEGSLQAESNGSGAGIGGGYNMDCGNIVIEGGTIIANGGESVSAIGVGGYGTCGDITIGSGVTKVTANNKMGASYPNIGGGNHGTCGVISIGGVVYFDGQDFQNGGEKSLVNFPYVYQGDGSGSVALPMTTSYEIGREPTGLKVPAGVYSLLSISKAGNELIVQVNRDSSVTLQAQYLNSFPYFSVGGGTAITPDEAFRGNLAEVRVWNHALSNTEKNSYVDRVLNGREQGLMLYWPMDEGLDRHVFDASYSNDMPNARHATVGNNIAASGIVPAEDKLSRYAITNANGEYIIRGIPFVGSGSTYTVTPSRGIHEFSPLSRNGFIGNGNLTLNSYDFTDISSFPVSGKVTYLNTNIPVDSVQFMIDGVLLQSKEGVRSDANGDFEISVPIGEHLIECYKNGHRFTSFPLDGTTYDFKRAETVNFVDSTLVNVTGRINGGFTDRNEPLGFGRSVNRVGQATIKLSLGKESQCSFNYVVDDHGDGKYGTKTIPVESATDDIQSTAYRAALKNDNTDTHYIYITTDAKTGEFSAMLPPLKYKVESIKFVGGTDYDDEPVFAQNLPMLDASNAIPEKMKKDSLEMDGIYHYYTYSAKMIRQLRAAPSITVGQDGQKNGAFGEKVIAVTNLDNSVDSVQVVRYSADGYDYVYGYPLFQQGKAYDFGIDIFERYVNLDTRKEFKEIPLDAVFTIMNDASATTTVYGEKATINGEQVEVGEAYKTLSIQITPDEKGHIAYQWEGGFPNLAAGHLRNVSIGVRVDGRTTMWQAPKSKTEALDLIMLGGVGSGTNFVTSGPAAVDMIIRRPPGSTSVASLTSKEVTAYNHTTIYNNWSKKIGGGAYFSETPTFEFSTGNVLGIAMLTNSKWKFVSQQTEVFNGTWTDKDAAVDDLTYTVTEQMTTPSSMVIDLGTMTFTPEGGDTYIGRATNLLFSKGRILGLFKQDDNSFALTEKAGITVSESFGTKFAYPQAYILNTLIPNWEAIIRSKLQEGHISGDHWDPNNTPKVPGKVIYYTKYSPGDAEFGRANGDIDFWTDEQLASTNGFPSYRMVDGTEAKDQDDEVEYAINQIKIWRERIADNERDKLKAFEDSESLIENYSIASGTKVSMTTESSRKTGDTHSSSYTFTWNQDMKFGPLINDAGANVIFQSVRSWGDGESKDTLRTKSTSVAWTMSDGDVRTALSVDVYNSPAGWGPIFRTRGGQTANPYEGASYTLFHQKGTKLNEATMKVENPQLKVLGSSELTDVPTGNAAEFRLQLFNQSETNDICNYVLQVKERSNPDGAILTIDGTPVSNGKEGRPIKMKGGETLEKTLIVMQSDRSVIDYEDIVLLLKSEKDPTIESDPVNLRVHFVPSSSPVSLAVDHTVVNKAYIDEGGGITASMTGLNRQDQGLQGLRLRYRRKGTDSWTLINQWTTIAKLVGDDYAAMPDTSHVVQKVKFPADGTYELQAQTFGMYGKDEVTYQSNIIEIIQDTHGPKMLGMVSPADGKLTIMNTNNMHIRFNEVLNGNALSKSDNFRIEGGMNNVVYGKGAYPDVAAQLNGNAVETTAMYNLENTDYAFDMWFYRQGDGDIISLGTENNLLALSTHDGGKLRARVGSEGDVYDAAVQLPENKWMYMALNYKCSDAEHPANTITMLYATADDKQPIFVGKDVPAKSLDGHGKLSIGGSGMKGMISGLSIWNNDITAQQLYETRNQQRAPFTPGLVGYWRMDEGHGRQITDLARSRHMIMPSESWYINNENRAAHLVNEEGSPLKIDISTFNPAKTDNFAYEMWFRGTEADNEGVTTLMSVQNGSSIVREVTDSTTVTTEAGNEYQQHTYKTVTTYTRTAIGFEEGRLKLKVMEDCSIHSTEGTSATTDVKNDVTLSERSYLDGNWHHLALNVRRGTSAIVYLDGEAVKVLPESAVPGVSSHYLIVGGEMSELRSEHNRFQGDVDEIRIWSAALDGQLVSERMYERMDSSYPGLVGYFPMESIHRNAQGTVVTEFTMDNFGESDSRLKVDTLVTTHMSQSANAPALKPGSTKMRLDDTQFNFTASADEIYFSFPESVLPLMDGNDFVATVSYIKDEHGNNSEPVNWIIHADFASVEWLGQGYGAVHVEKAWDETRTFTEMINNLSGATQTYEISGLPTWMTVDKPIATISNDIEDVTFTISPSAPIGRHIEYIYLTDRNKIRRMLPIEVVVKGNEPEWSVNPDLYESNMMLVGQVNIEDKINENSDTKVAAFDEMGNCRGVASPEYVSTRDAYFVNMIVYGASSTTLSTGETDLTFKLYDASTGRTYPIVNVMLPGKEPTTSMRYVQDAIYGSYDTPVVFNSTNLIEQGIQLPAGWTWMSIYVNPTSTAIADVLPRSKAERKRFMNIKSHTAIASVNQADGIVAGSLKEITPGSMYKVQLSASVNYNLTGSLINVRDTAATIASGWNWIGSLANGMMSVKDAFADLDPTPGDVVKSRTQFATYRGDGVWEGTLQSITPSVGYIYHSLAPGDKTFHYPSPASGTLSANHIARHIRRADESLRTAHYEPVDNHLFPDNMNLIAVVKRAGAESATAEVGAFVGGECRGAASYDNGYYFLTVMGSAADDAGNNVEIRIYDEGAEYVVAHFPFTSDAIYGTLESPFELDVDKTGIGHATSDCSDDFLLFNPQGQRIDKPRRGVNIIRNADGTSRKVLMK